MQNNPHILTEEEAFSALTDKERSDFRQVTFTLHESQSEQVEKAIQASKAVGVFTDSPNKNSNGNALARICDMFLMTQK